MNHKDLEDFSKDDVFNSEVFVVQSSRSLLSGVDACKMLAFEILLPEMHES